MVRGAYPTFMADYRRYYVPGGTYFFTLKTENNAPVFHDISAVRLLGNIMRQEQQSYPFNVIAMVLLPDHLHAVWTLPSGDINYPKRWGRIKSAFTKQHLQDGGVEQLVSTSKQKYRRRGIWQRRYWEHTIIDEHELSAYVDYIHWNPIKHGYVTRAIDWPHSSFHRYLKSNSYPPNWGSDFT